MRQTKLNRLAIYACLILTALLGSTATAQAQFCNIWYVSDSGTGPGTPSSPASLATALANVVDGGTILMESGTYIDSPTLVIPNNVIIDGGYTVDANYNWTKSTNTATFLLIAPAMQTANLNSTSVGFYIGILPGSNDELKDLSIYVFQNNPTGTYNNMGLSVYGIYLNGVQNVLISRCNVYTSNGTPGAAGGTPAGSGSGNVGGEGGNGNTNTGTSGGGCGGKGGNGFAPAIQNWGAETGGNGGGSCCSSGANTAGCGSNGCNPPNNGGAGSTGGNANPTTGQPNGSPGSTDQYYVPVAGVSGYSGDGGTGGGGGGSGAYGTCCECGIISNCGGTTLSGGNGGQGGNGGAGGYGGYGGGGSFAIWAYGSTSGSIIDCSLNPGTGGAGGAGGAGQPGGAGLPGLPGIQNGGCRGGGGASGGNGGDGGTGGQGQQGATGAAIGVFNSNGATVAVSGSPYVPTDGITTANWVRGCTNSEITLTKNTNDAWGNFIGTDAQFENNLTASTSSFNSISDSVVIYYPATSATGDKTITVGAVNLNDFIILQGNNRLVNPAAGIIAAIPNPCPGDSIYLSNTLSSNQLANVTAYEWEVSQVSNPTNIIYTYYTANPAGVPPPVGGWTAGATYQVRLRLYETCCGWSIPIWTQFTVNVPSAMPISINATANPFCAGQSATLSIIGGALGTSAGWVWYNDSCGGTAVGSGTSITVSPAVTTTYYVQALGTTGCSNTPCQQITVSVSPLPSGFISGGAAFCSGGSDTLSFNFTAGSGPFNVVYSNGITNFDLNFVNSGNTITVSPGSTTTYQFDSITDQNGCVATSGFGPADRVTVLSPPALNSVNATNVVCVGSNNGTITINASTLTPPVLYSIDGGVTYRFSNTFDSLIPGAYDVVVEDTIGCSAAYSGNPVIIKQDSAQPVVLSVALYQNPLCYGDSSGEILLSAAGGQAPYNYSWSNNASTQDINNLQSGTYSVTVIDAIGCKSTLAQTLSQPSPLSSSVSSTNAVCYNIPGGSATVTSVSGGTGPYSYLWSNFAVGATAQNLIGGNYYSVIITDHNGCKQQDSVFVAQPAQLSISDSISNFSCYNANNGSITLTVSGGTTPYNYSWSNGSTAQNISGLASGTFSVTVTDAFSCSASAMFLLSSDAQLLPNETVQNELCFQDTLGLPDSTGAIILSPTGGTPPLSFAWADASGNPISTSQNLNNLGVGSYYVTITDSKGCAVADSGIITAPPVFYVTGIVSNVTCYGDSNGIVFQSAYGGVPPYSFLWSESGTNFSSFKQNLNGLSAGDYRVTTTDANGCRAQSEYNILQPQALQISIAAVNITCYGACSGSLTSQVTGGTTPLNYLWSNFSTQTNIQNACAGNYSLLVTDSSGCRAFDSATVTQPAQIVISATVTGVACNGQSTGSINLNVSGGVQPLSYSWSNGATSSSLANLDAGVYTITVNDLNNCSLTSQFTISQTSGILITVSPSSPVCFGGHDGFIAASVSGGDAPYQYMWSTLPAQNTAIATDLTPGSYTLTVTDSAGCTAQATATLSNADSLSITNSTINSRCFNPGSGSLVLNILGGGTPPFTFLLNGISQPTDTFNNLKPGAYTVLILDANGCVNSDTFSIAPLSSEVTVSLGTTYPTILTGMETQLIANAVSTQNIIHYIWSPLTVDSGNVFDFTNCSDSTDCSSPYVKPPYTTTFTVQVENSDSCVATDTITIYVQNQPVAFIPTAFTPNNDGLNDKFTFAVLGAQNIEVSIFDRWGQRVYYNANQADGMGTTDAWDGTINGGKQCPNDTYIYQMKVTYFDGTTKDIAGTVTIMR